MKNSLVLSAVLSFLIFFGSINVNACTGIRLKAKDGGIAYGRSMEWGSFDLHSRIAIIPQGYTFYGMTPEGENGKKFNSKYGIVGLDMVGKDFIADGMNEKGLAVGLFYHPGFAKYPEYRKSNAKNSISAQDVSNFILSQFENVEEVKKGMQKITVVGVIEETIGIIVQAHWMVTDAKGHSIVIEYTNGKLKIHEAPLGVITNSPNYDWHMTNVRNYINLSMYSFPEKELSGIKMSPIGGGTGFLGLPGDNTPPSRFIRAVAWTHTARPLENAEEAVYESFRILDNFQLPLGPDAAEGTGTNNNKDLMRSSTIWTTVWDLTDLTLNYHTQHNRRIRRLNLKKIDFSNIGDKIVHINLDTQKEQDIQNITPIF